MVNVQSGSDKEEERLILERVLRASEADPELQVTDVESAPACAVGDNFMSAVSRLVVSVETVKKYSTKRCFLMKRQLASRERRDALRCDPAFRNEAEAYQVVIPALEKFSGSRLPFPECIHASSELVILDDLKQADFRMANRRRGLDFLQASLAISELGKFHGISLAMKASEPRKFNRIKRSVQEIAFVPQSAPVFGEHLENSLSIALRGLKMNCEKNHNLNEIAPLLGKLERLQGSLFQNLFQIVCPREPLAVICHGDFYNNNLLFRYNEMNLPEEVCFVDLQACRYSSLATDVLYFLATSLEPKLLASSHDTLFRVYYTALQAQISRNSFQSTKVSRVSIEEIKEEVRGNALYGLVMGFLLLPAVTAKPGAIDIDRDCTPTIEETMKFLSPEYFERVTDLVLTFHKIGYL